MTLFSFFKYHVFNGSMATTKKDVQREKNHLYSSRYPLHGPHFVGRSLVAQDNACRHLLHFAVSRIHLVLYFLHSLCTRYCQQGGNVLCVIIWSATVVQAHHNQLHEWTSHRIIRIIFINTDGPHESLLIFITLFIIHCINCLTVFVALLNICLKNNNYKFFTILHY